MRLIPTCAMLILGSTLAASVPAADTAMDEAARMQYALGYQLGRDLVAIEPRPQDILKGIEDGRSGGKAKLSQDEMSAALAGLQQKVAAQREKEQAATSEKAAAAGKAYLAANATKPGVTTTASGLQYQVLTAGTGRTPAIGDTVTVHYKGTLVDGTEFDSSYKRGQPASFPVAGVIPGWTEALQLMKVGTKAQLVIPPELAYGSNGPLANQVLLFDVELLGAMATPVEEKGK
jgi:FKBP-type peptidyl-prolyl cis-trans isomerase FklB